MNVNQALKEFIDQYSKKVEIHLESSFPNDWPIPSSLLQSMNYSLLAGGKRMRPLLLLAAVKAMNGSLEEALPAASAVEMIHTYSLIHDDLPAMDDDDYRRGKPTNHKVFGEAMAILAGDGLLTHAFYMLESLAHTSRVPESIILKLISELSRLAGPAGMVGGQVSDIEAMQGEVDIPYLEKLHRHKTGDLIVFALKAGGMIGQANEQQLHALEEFGYRIGLAFQIQDDVLDVIGDERKLGKSTQRDSELDKVTYPQLLGLDACRTRIKELTEEGKERILEAQFPNPEKLLMLADYLMHRDH